MGCDSERIFNLEEDETEGKLVSLDAPRMIIVTDDNQYWFHGLTTGYAGQGCGGTEEVLLKLGVIEKDKYPVKLEIQTYRVLHYYRENGKWTFPGKTQNEICIGRISMVMLICADAMGN